MTSSGTNEALPFLLQTCKRDTGEVMHDLSVPIYVNDRHRPRRGPYQASPTPVP